MESQSRGCAKTPILTVPREDGTLEMARLAVWGMLYVGEVRVASTSPRGLAGMMDVIVVAYQDFGLTLPEKIEAMHLWSDPSTASNALRIAAADQRYKHTYNRVCVPWWCYQRERGPRHRD